MSVASNIAEIRAHVPASVSLVCVSKFHNADAIMEAYRAGERIFGEYLFCQLFDHIRVNL